MFVGEKLAALKVPETLRLLAVSPVEDAVTAPPPTFKNAALLVVALVVVAQSVWKYPVLAKRLVKYPERAVMARAAMLPAVRLRMVVLPKVDEP